MYSKIMDANCRRNIIKAYFCNLRKTNGCVYLEQYRDPGWTVTVFRPPVFYFSSGISWVAMGSGVVRFYVVLWCRAAVPILVSCCLICVLGLVCLALWSLGKHEGLVALLTVSVYLFIL